VPMLYPDPGMDLTEGGVEAGRAALEKYNVDDYHKPSDEYSSDWDFTAIVADANLAYRTGERIANSTLWPNWYIGNEFRGVRDASRNDSR